MPQEPFVKRFEHAAMQFVILQKAREAGEVTKENLRKTFQGNLKMGDHLDHCLNLLVEDGHLQEAGSGKYRISDDGREDVQKLEHVVLEVANLVGGQQGGKGQGMQSQANQSQSQGASTQGAGGATGESQRGKVATTTAGTQTSTGTTGTAGATGSKPIDPPNSGTTSTMNEGGGNKNRTGQ